MAVSTQEIENFFADYATALAGREASTIAGHWAAPGLVLSDDGAIPYTKIKDVEDFFGGAMGQYQKVSSTSATVRSALPLAENVVGCDIFWEHRDKTNKPIGGEEGFYVLKRSGGRLRIHFYTPKTGRAAVTR
jgi:hypothetical protein